MQPRCFFCFIISSGCGISCPGGIIALLGKPFLFVPILLAVFPVLYYLLAAIWAGNIPAAAITAIFGAAHITVSAMSFR